MIKEYRTIQEINGPLMVVRKVQDVTYDELAEIELPDGTTRRCKVLEIDGGNSWDKFWNITLPMVSSTLFFNLVNGIIGALQVFSQAYIITEGGPNNASLFYVYNLWRQAFKYMDMGKASAMAWILFVVVMLLTVIVFKSSKKWVYYEGGND